ncbi:MAG TPA: DUF4440 domain-containing protein [Vicinamibacterales bacterium]|nr:DUF4440 domain-containing protein [Vicinamibacterales bacterium]
MRDRLGRTIVCIAGTLLIGACAEPAPPPVDLQKEEQAIRKLDDDWNAMIAKKDVDGIVKLYAADGATMWPDAPASKGTDAIRAAWVELFKAPGISGTIVADRIQIAQSGDLALDEGHVNLEMDTPQGRAKETVKYLVGWKKVGGAWKVAYDMYNSNAPAAPPPPPTPAKGKGK